LYDEQQEGGDYEQQEDDDGEQQGDGADAKKHHWCEADELETSSSGG
jgi:hypothetical protein